MKVVVIGMGLSGVAFFAMAMQMGLLQSGRPAGGESVAVEKEDAAVPPRATAKFPSDLAPAARAVPVPAAADFKSGTGAHPIAFLKLNGELHPWQESVREEWQAETVAATELVVVVGNPKKIFVDRIVYPPPAPPIDRYIFELEISVIEAKTGRILANRLFRNLPRRVRQMEAWETTAFGRMVSMQQVFSWVSQTSRNGFPVAHDSTPIMQEVD